MKETVIYNATVIPVNGDMDVFPGGSVHIKGNESDDAVSKSMDIRLCTVCILEICHE